MSKEESRIDLTRSPVMLQGLGPWRQSVDPGTQPGPLRGSGDHPKRGAPWLGTMLLATCTVWPPNANAQAAPPVLRAAQVHTALNTVMPGVLVTGFYLERAIATGPGQSFVNGLC
jgi:hypothetical protein